MFERPVRYNFSMTEGSPGRRVPRRQRATPLAPHPPRAACGRAGPGESPGPGLIVKDDPPADSSVRRIRAPVVHAQPPTIPQVRPYPPPHPINPGRLFHVRGARTSAGRVLCLVRPATTAPTPTPQKWRGGELAYARYPPEKTPPPVIQYPGGTRERRDGLRRRASRVWSPYHAGRRWAAVGGSDSGGGRSQDFLLSPAGAPRRVWTSTRVSAAEEGGDEWLVRLGHPSSPPSRRCAL